MICDSAQLHTTAQLHTRPQQADNRWRPGVTRAPNCPLFQCFVSVSMEALLLHVSDTLI
jgi:hypothetical protein